MAQSTQYLEVILNLNSRLFTNALDGVSEEQAKERVSDHSNPLHWIAAHTVWARNMMCAILGNPDLNEPHVGMFENFKPFDPTNNYPGIEDSRSSWVEATNRLNSTLASVSDSTLAATAPMPNPTGDASIGGTLAFLAQHESYDIGQIGYLKKYFTREAMKY